MNNLALVKWDDARRAVAEAKNVDELKNVRDKAEVMRAYAKQVAESLEVQNDICEIKLRAERRMGEMIKADPNIKAGRKLKSLHDERIKLKDFGVSEIQSHRYQQIAGLSSDVFENTIQSIKQDEKELTEAFLLNIAKKINRAEEIQALRDNIANNKVVLPEGKFEIIVIDPPWAYGENYDPKGNRASCPYPSMSFEELEELQIPSTDDSILFLWTTHRFIWDAKKLLEKWGFNYKAILVWNKKSMGLGVWLRMQCEFCLIGIKGKPVWTLSDERDIIEELKTSHSRKPDGFYGLVNGLCIGRKLDFFARKKREGWSVFGTLEKNKGGLIK